MQNDLEETFLGGAIPELTINASNGAVVKISFNIVLHREEDTLRRFAAWIEHGQAVSEKNAVA